MSSLVRLVLLLTAANVFMTFAWYAHLRHGANRPLFWVIVASWGIAFFEYCLQVPANRIGHQTYSVAQLKITQEVITLAVFMPFAVFYMGERLTWNYLFAGLCLVGAVYFVFRG